MWQTTITYIGLAIAVVVLIVANVPWGSIGGLFKGSGGSSKPDAREAAIKGYEAIKAYLKDDPDIKAIWGKLS